MDIDRPPRSRRHAGRAGRPAIAFGFRAVPGLVPGGQDAWAPHPPAIDEPGGWAGAALAAPVGCPFVLDPPGPRRPPLARASPPPPPPASVPMIATGSVYVLVDGLGDGDGDGESAPDADDFPGAVRLVDRLLLRGGSGATTSGPSIGPGGRCADTGLLAFYASPDAAEEAAARGLAAELVGGGPGPAGRPPPPPPPGQPPGPRRRSTAPPPPPLITSKASVLRPPTDALQRRHWGGRAAAAAWEAAARAASAGRVSAAAMRAAVAARGVRPGDADAAARRPPSIVAIPLGVALEAMTAGDRAWATLTPRPPAWPGGGEGGGRGQGGRERPWWALGRRHGAAEEASAPPTRPPPPPPPPSAPAYALPCTCVLIDTPAGPVGFIPTFLDVGVLRRTWATYVAASARWWLVRRSLERGQWRAGVEAGAVSAFGTGGRLVSGGGGGPGGGDDDDAAAPPKPPGRGGIRDKDEDPPEVKEMEAALRAAVASAMGGGAGGPPPWARGGRGADTDDGRGGGRGRPPPWAGAPRPVQAVLALAATALTGAVCATARAAEAAGDLADELLVRTPLVGPALAGLPSTRPVVVETTLSSAARAASFFNGMNSRIVAAGVAAGRWPPPPAAWQGVARPPPDAGEAAPRVRASPPAGPSVSALAPPPVAGGGDPPSPPTLGGGGPPPPTTTTTTTATASASAPAPITSLVSPPPAAWSPPPWDAVIGAVMQGVDYMVDVKVRELVWARLHQLGVGRSVGLPARDWAREQREAAARHQQQQPPPRPGGLPGWPALRPPPHRLLLAPPAVLTGDPRRFRRSLAVAGEFIEAGAEAGFAPRSGAPDLMLSAVGAVLRGRGASFDTRIGGSGLLLVGDVGADGSEGLPWPWPDPAYGDAAALVVEEEDDGEEDGGGE